MFDQNSLIFLAIGVVGLAIMIFGFKYVDTARKVIETIGAVLFHVGAFGIIYLKTPLSLFVSIIAVVLSLFILIDPLKIGPHLHSRIYKLFGFIALFISVIFFLEYATGFPVWLWIIPVVLYLIPYLITPLKKIAWFISLVSWLLIFSYAGISGYVLYAQINPGIDTTLVSKLFPQLRLKVRTPQPALPVTLSPEPTPAPSPQDSSQPQPQPPVGP